MWILGIELSTLFLYSKHFTNWIISPASNLKADLTLLVENSTLDLVWQITQDQNLNMKTGCGGTHFKYHTESDSGGSPCVGSHPGLYTRFKDSRGYTERPCFKTNKQHVSIKPPLVHEYTVYMKQTDFGFKFVLSIPKSQALLVSSILDW